MQKPTLEIDTEWSAAAVRRWRAIPPDDEDWNGSFFEVVGFPVLEKPGDAIPAQSVFVASVNAQLIFAEHTEDQVGAMRRLFEFLLQPEYAAYHRQYERWRLTVRAKCDELCADPRSSRRLRALCRRFQRLYPA